MVSTFLGCPLLIRPTLARLGLGILYQLHDITNLPKPVRHTSRHSRRRPSARRWTCCAAWRRTRPARVLESTTTDDPRHPRPSFRRAGRSIAGPIQQEFLQKIFLGNLFWKYYAETEGAPLNIPNPRRPESLSVPFQYERRFRPWKSPAPFFHPMAAARIGPAQEAQERRQRREGHPTPAARELWAWDVLCGRWARLLSPDRRARSGAGAARTPARPFAVRARPSRRTMPVTPRQPRQRPASTRPAQRQSDTAG